MCRVQQDRVFRSLERGIGAVAVALVAGAQFADDLFRLRGFGIAGCVSGRSDRTAQAANFRGRIEEDLHVRMGKDNGADVAAFHDHAAGCAEFLL